MAGQEGKAEVRNMKSNGMTSLRDLFNTNRNMETVIRLFFGRKILNLFSGYIVNERSSQTTSYDQIAKLDWNRLDFLGWLVPA